MRKLLACVFACLPIAVLAQPADPIPVWTEIETVQAEARPGPAVWRVARGESDRTTTSIDRLNACAAGMNTNGVAPVSPFNSCIASSTSCVAARATVPIGSGTTPTTRRM